MSFTIKHRPSFAAVGYAAEAAGAATAQREDLQRAFDRASEFARVAYQSDAADRRFAFGQHAETQREINQWLNRRASMDYEMSMADQKRLERINGVLAKVDEMEQFEGLDANQARQLRFNIQMEHEGITQRLQPKKKNPTVDEWMAGNTRTMPDGRMIAMMPDGTIETWMPPKSNPDVEAKKLAAQDQAALTKQEAAERKEKLEAGRQQILDAREEERYQRELEEWREEQQAKLHDRAHKLVELNLKQGYDDIGRKWREGFSAITFDQALERLGGDRYAPKKDPANAQQASGQPGQQQQEPKGPSLLQRPTMVPGAAGSVINDPSQGQPSQGAPGPTPEQQYAGGPLQGYAPSRFAELPGPKSPDDDPTPYADPTMGQFTIGDTPVMEFSAKLPPGQPFVVRDGSGRPLRDGEGRPMVQPFNPRIPIVRNANELAAIRPGTAFYSPRGELMHKKAKK